MDDHQQPTPTPRSRRSAAPPDDQPGQPPWRTEGMPRWLRNLLVFLVVYLGSFALLSWQDGWNSAPTIPYTAFLDQVQARNVSQVYAQGDSLQGTLRQARPVPGGQHGATYEQFKT